MSLPVRVFHCDDSGAFRLLAREMLAELGGVESVGGAARLDEALAALPAARADVVLVDLLEARDLELIGQLRAVCKSARLLLYTGMPEEAAPSGADGYVHKGEPFEALHTAILDLAGRP